jgi:prepilin-type N-terminal cleavage/methylation domain-containing protein
MKGTNLITRLRRRGDQGLTLIELLIVITILGILAGIALLAAAPFRSKSEAAASVTDAEVLKSAQQAYCVKTGTYASRTRDLNTPPNDVLDRLPGFNGTVKWPTPESAGLLTYDFSATPSPPDDDAKDLYLGYRAGGAGAAVDGPMGCGNTGYVVGATSAAGQPLSGPLFLADSDTTPALNFLQNSFVARFGPFAPTTMADVDLGALATATVPTVANQALLITPPIIAAAAPVVNANVLASRQIASGQLMLVACRSGAISVPIDNTCKSPALLEAPDLFSAPDATNVNMAALKTELQGHPVCTTGPLLVTLPTGTPFGDAAAAALSAAGFTASGAGCVVTAANVAAAEAILRNGGSLGTPAKWGLLPKAVLTDPSGIDTNWGSVVPLVAPLKIYAAVLKPPAGDLSGEALALRFINYLLSPLGQAALQAYGFGPVDTPGAGASLPVAESNS